MRALLSLGNLKLESLDHRVSQQLLAHLPYRLFGRRCVGGFQSNVEVLASAERFDLIEPQPAQCSGDRVALRVVDRRFRCDADVGSIPQNPSRRPIA